MAKKKYIEKIRSANKAYTDDVKQTQKEVNEIVENGAKEALDSIEKTNNLAEKITQEHSEYLTLLNKKGVQGLTMAEEEKLDVLKESIKNSEKLRDSEFDNLKMQYKLKNISAEDYYTQLAIMRDTYFSEGSAGWAKYSLEILEYNESVISEQKKTLLKIFSEISSEYEKSFDAIINKQENMFNKLSGISDIYHKISVNGAKEGESYTWLQLSNIDHEVEALKNYNNALIGVKERTDKIFESFNLDDERLFDLKSSFFDEIASLNVGEGIGFSNYLLNISDEKLHDYLSKWVEKMNLSEVISKSLYYDEVDVVVGQYAKDLTEAFTTETIEGLKVVPDAFYEKGSVACLEFKNGFMSAFDTMMNEIVAEIDKKLGVLKTDISYPVTNNSVTNNSNYNIYESGSAQMTALEIYKQDARKRMLTE